MDEEIRPPSSEMKSWPTWLMGPMISTAIGKKRFARENIVFHAAIWMRGPAIHWWKIHIQCTHSQYTTSLFLSANHIENRTRSLPPHMCMQSSPLDNRFPPFPLKTTVLSKTEHHLSCPLAISRVEPECTHHIGMCNLHHSNTLLTNRISPFSWKL